MIKRSSGILLPIFSLPSKYGIGTLGKEAKRYIDFLSDAKQKYWQILPVGPTSYGDSPYQSFSTFAGNPYFIDLEMLIDNGLLTKKECDAIDWGTDASHVDYGKIYENRFTLLYKAYERGYKRDLLNVTAFREENKGWLSSYALYMACKRHFLMKAWYEWDDESIRLHEASAVAEYSERLQDDIRFFIYIQYLFYLQWKELRSYAHEKGIYIIGDMPIYVARDSADVWAESEWFQLDQRKNPTAVAGVPPDYFSEDGQLWGNPLYDWDKMKEDGYGWWIRRVDGMTKLYDVLRIDHFRGLESYWSVPYGDATAKNGKWVKGPGMDFVGRITSWFYQMEFIAEDLGLLTPEVKELLKQSGLPGMRVLEFAFDSTETSNYLTHNYNENCICYIGTHDNATIKDWFENGDLNEIAFAVKYLGLNKSEGYTKGMIRGGMSSVANLFVTQMQDYLGLGAEARINTPGIEYGNWQWRMKKTACTKKLAQEIASVTLRYGRAKLPVKEVPAEAETEPLTK